MMRFNNTYMALFGTDRYYREIKFEKWEELGPKLEEYFESGENDIDWHLQESLICYEGFENGFHTVWITRLYWDEKGESPGFRSNDGSPYSEIGGSPTQRIR